MTSSAANLDCAWWCFVCKACHDNACPCLWGGQFIPGLCGHQDHPTN